MSNPLFSALGGNNSIMSMLQQLKSNPTALLARRFNLPDGIQNDPQAIVQHLVSSGQVSQAQINRAYQQAQQMGFKS